MIKKFSPNLEIIKDLSFLEEYYSNPPERVNTKEGLQYTSESSLDALLGKPVNVCEVSRLSHISLSGSEKSSLYQTLSRYYPKCSILLSGHFFYPENGYMSWHTNEDAPGLRLYLSYTEYEGESFFIYRDGGKIIKDPDLKGWTAREFEINSKSPLWHSVYADKPRISVGFRIIRNLL